LAVYRRIEQIPLFDELFVITLRWGYGYFHQVVEVLPRTAAYLRFLKENPQIRILVPQGSKVRLANLLRMIGLSSKRLVTGHSRARIVYQPRSTCGSANVPEIQMLSRLYRNYIERNLSPQPRNKLVLIRRSRLRRFTKQREIQNVLKLAAKDFNLTYALFPDNPTPRLRNAMKMFYSAVIIVAPMGAAESNMLFAQPGTYVVEGFCNPPLVNLCYQRLAFVLGHHWHGIMSRRGCGGVIDVTATSVDDAVRSYLSSWSKMRRSL